MKNFFSLFLLSFFSFCAYPQNWLYIAPGAAKWVDAGDLDVAGSQITVEALITRIPGGSTLNIVSKHTDPGNVNYLLRPLAFSITTSDGFISLNNPVPLSLNVAYHVAGTYDGSTIKYYVNGCLTNSAAWTGTLVLSNLITAIGNQSTNQTEPFTGYIDEVRIWNVARTQAEIQANMNTLPNPTTQSGLIAYYTFDPNYNNMQGNATWNGTPVGSTALTTNPNWTGNINNLSVTATNTDNICFGGTVGTISATATGAFSPYTYSVDGTNYQSSNTFTALASGTYTVYAQTNASCIATTTVTITQPPQIIINIVQNPAPCDSFATATATASGGTGSSYTYSWNTSPAQNSQTATGLTAGNYTVSATDVNNCTESNNINIVITTPLSTTFNTISATCIGSCNGIMSASPSGGNSPYSFLWNNGQTSQVAGNLCQGTAVVTITDVNSCSFVDSVFVSQSLPFSVSVSSTNSNCGQPDGSASVTSVSGGGNPGFYSYQWDASANNQTSATATGLTDGVYFVTITSGSCDTVVPDTVGYNPPPVASATSFTEALCFGYCNGTGTVTATGGPAPLTYAYLWDNGETSQTATALCAGIHIATVTDSTGCSDTAVFLISEPALLVSAISGDTSICVSGTVTLSATATGGTSPYGYLWSNGWNSQGPNSENPIANTCYDVTVTDSNGCKDTSSLSCATLYPPISVSSLSDDTICENNSVVLGASATGGHPDSTITFLWNTGTADDSATVTPTTYPLPETYFVVASDGCSPNDTDSVTISYYLTPAVTFTSDTASGCMPLTINFENTTANIISCLWNFGDGNSSAFFNPSNTYQGLGSYDVSLSVVSSDGCPASATVNNYISVNPLPPADAGNDTTIYQETSAALTAQGGTSYLWSTGETDNTITVIPTETTTYFVTVTDEKGCQSIGEVTVTIDFEYVIFVPSMFSPNNDGNNDMLFVRGIGIKDFSLQIYDRWGEKIFESKEQSTGWDGKHKGKNVNTGVYVFFLKGNLDNGTKVEKKGSVTLVR